MNLLHFITAAVFLALGVVEAQIENTTQEYRLKTDLKPGQRGKQRFNNLYIEAYHTGAGLSDAVMVKNATQYIVGFLNGTNGEAGGVTYQNQVFDLNTTFASSMLMDISDTFYTGWQPVRINAGDGPSDPDGNSGFWINGSGLQWTSAPDAPPDSEANAFAGWLVCDWWHGVPQLFFRLDYDTKYPAPCSCAEVYLCPEYI